MKALKHELSIIHKTLWEKIYNDRCSDNFLNDIFYIVDNMIRNIELVENINIDNKPLKKYILSNIPDTWCIWTDMILKDLGINKNILNKYKDLYKI